MTDYEKIRVEANAEIHKEYPLLKNAISHAYYVEVLFKAYDRLSGKIPPSTLKGRKGPA